MTKAFICGKFLPFHKGHEAMIRFALSKCDLLTVLICCSDKETIPANIRKQWIKRSFKFHEHIEIKTFDYLESEFPNTSVSSREVSKIWANKFKTLFPDYDLLISSERYGDYIAEFMDIKHIAFDVFRQQFKISATDIRNQLWNNWSFLPDSVKPYFAIKVVILGTESTGKSRNSQNTTIALWWKKLEEILLPIQILFSLMIYCSLPQSTQNELRKQLQENHL